MPRVILLAAIAAIIYLLYRRASSAPPHKRRSEFIKLGLGVALVTVIILAVTGRMHWIGVAVTALLVVLRQLGPLLIRLFPMLSARLGHAGPSAGQSSRVATEILAMQLDHDSGELSGEVLQGDFEGWRLQDMDREQLRQLYEFCKAADPESVQLLDSYLEQRFPGEHDFEREQQAGTSDNGSGMSRDEALAVLGLEADADEEAIIAAHRKLMQKLHPDRGGNDYLAAKINQAKDLLLG